MPKISEKYQKDYKNVSFKNPRIIKEEKDKQQRIKKLIWIFIGLILAGIFYFFCFSDYFRIKNVSIEGINKINKDKFQQIVENYQHDRQFLIFSHNNLLFFSSQGLKDKIGESYLLDNIEITKQWPDQVKIVVIEKEASIVWLTNNQCLHLDDEGYVIELCENQENNFIMIKDLSNTPVKVGEQAISAETIKYLFGAKDKLQQKIEPVMFRVDLTQPQTIRIQTKQNFDILMNQELDFQSQIDRLFLLLENQDIKNNLNAINYFDLRFGEKVYYK